MACAHFMRKRGFDMAALFVDYGQAARHHEAVAASLVAKDLNLQLRTGVVQLEATYGLGEVPGRNALLTFAAIATGAAGQAIAMGIHSGTPYYDCSPVFVKRMDILLQEHTSGLTRFLAPFVSWSKREICDFCRDQGLNLSLTYSCEAGTAPPCGQCASCLDRQLLDAC
jgi:7-cyano-7-deazaguanine synthase